ncbi:putative right-handed parallel beta-helix repeat-containing protein [Pseudomonas phage Ep4]|uniref:Right-handed parallel beta-helix repeat-containing protein n=1 Tax=Pseudomonas phage Ep4 TaxID=3057492 RepID=A0AAU9ESW3_9CAUD|nr:putative right-handed parallel beta-helix repeat-containing protein [Pseudomonas phage Ep4]
MSTLSVDVLESLDKTVNIAVKDLVTLSVIGNTLYTVTNYAALAVVNPAQHPRVYIQGYYNAGDGGDGYYTYSGGWVLQHSGSVNILQFGAVPGLSGNNYAAITAAINAVKNYGTPGRGGVVIIPNGTFTYAGTLLLDSQCVSIRGQGGHASFLRGTTLDVPLVKITAPYCFITGVEVATSGTGTAGSTGIEVSGSDSTILDTVVAGVFDGVRYRGGSMHKVDRIAINDCGSTGFLFYGDTLFLNDVFISNFFIGSNDPSKFALGHFRALGRVEALMLSKGDTIGGTFAFTCDALGTSGLRYSSFESVYFDSTSQGAIFEDAAHLHFTDCWASNGRGFAAPAITFNRCKNFSVKGLQAYNAGGAGALFNNCSSFSVANSDATANSVDGSNAGFTLINCTRFTISDCTGEKGATGKQSFGLLVGAGCTDYRLLGNNFYDNISGPIAEDAGNSNREVAFNRGYVTYTKGAGSLPASTTSMTVNHGLVRTPLLQDISLTPNGATASPLYVSAVNATTFTVGTLNANAGASPFCWKADIMK